MKPRLYIETTIPSYLVARSSGNPVIVGHQQTTREWWATCRERFDLFISQFVLDEAARGDTQAAADRVATLADVTELEILPGVTELAERLVEKGAVPVVAKTDSLHIAIAAVHGMDFLVTWKLPSHRQRHQTRANPPALPRRRMAVPGNLHARTTHAR